MVEKLDWSGRRPLWKNPLFWILAVAVLARLPLLLYNEGILWPDSLSYLATAKDMVLRGDFAQNRMFNTPLYPMFLAAFLKFLPLAPSTGWLIILAQHLLGVGSTLLFWRGGRRLFGNAAALIGALLFTLHPVVLYYEHVIHTETLFIFILAWLFARVARAPESPGGWRAAEMGLLCGLLTLTRPVAKLLVLTLLLWLVFRLRRPRPALFRGIVLLLVFAVVLLPWMFYNYKNFGYFDISKGEGTNLRIRAAYIGLKEPQVKQRDKAAAKQRERSAAAQTDPAARQYKRAAAIQDAPAADQRKKSAVVQDKPAARQHGKSAAIQNAPTAGATPRRKRRGTWADRLGARAKQDDVKRAKTLRVIMSRPGFFVLSSLRDFFLIMAAPGSSVQFDDRESPPVPSCLVLKDFHTDVFPNRPVSRSLMVRRLVHFQLTRLKPRWIALFAFFLLGAVSFFAKSGRDRLTGLLLLSHVAYFALSAAVFIKPIDRFFLPALGFYLLFAAWGAVFLFRILRGWLRPAGA